MTFDAAIIGGGPAGLSAALALGRARKRVLLCDAGARRNATAERVQNFVTRDGTPPDEFRRIAREQLLAYPAVDVRDEPVLGVTGERGAFRVRLSDRSERDLEASRVLVCTGMIDELPDLEGFREHWGRSVFQCPYCHGWEIQGRRFAVLASSVEMLDFAIFLTGWTGDVLALTDGRFPVPPETRDRLDKSGVALDERRLTGLFGSDGHLARIRFSDGAYRPAEVLFARPPQRQVPLVQSMGLALTAAGYVEVSDPHRQTSIPGVYAAGDLVTPMQAAIFAAASGTQAAAMLNHELTVELALARGTLLSQTTS